MPLSLRSIAQNCYGKTPPLSALNDIFGYFMPPGQELSLKRQLELSTGEALNVNVILVADENFTWTDLEETHSAIQFARDVYEQVDIGIRKIRWQAIHAADAGGYATINSSSEAHDLTDDWNGPNGGYLDVFIVRSMTHADGVSAVDGPCDKDDKNEMTGSVVSLNGSYSNSGNTFAHEVGHYLGLSHVASNTNFIGSNGASNSNTGITNSQGNTMKSHCYVTDTC